MHRWILLGRCFLRFYASEPAADAVYSTEPLLYHAIINSGACVDFFNVRRIIIANNHEAQAYVSQIRKCFVSATLTN
jgi:hypothetical protein